MGPSGGAEELAKVAGTSVHTLGDFLDLRLNQVWGF